MALSSSKQRAESFSSAEQTLLMETYEEYKDVIMTKGNTVAIIRAREAAWQRIADRLNASNLSSQKRTWQQVKIKHKNILSSATRKQTQQRASGEGPLPEELTPAETLALSLNKGSRIDLFHSGSSSNPVDPDFRPPFIDERGDEVILLDPSQPQEEPDDPAGTQDDRGDDHQEREEEEEEEEALSVSDCLLQDVESGGDGRAMTFSEGKSRRVSFPPYHSLLPPPLESETDVGPTLRLFS